MKFLLILVTILVTGCSSSPPVQENYYYQGAYLNQGPRQGNSSTVLIYNRYQQPIQAQPVRQPRESRASNHSHHRSDYRSHQTSAPVAQAPRQPPPNRNSGGNESRGSRKRD